MGLDVGVYKNVKITDDREDYSFVAFVIDDSWLHKIKNLKNGGYYNGEYCCSGVSYSYGGHNRFRELLIKLIDRSDLLDIDGKINFEKLNSESEIPFYDFINFADNEGCLDWEVSKKIHGDFVKFKDKINNSTYADTFYIDKYMDWIEVFENGKNKNSVVVFH